MLLLCVTSIPAFNGSRLMTRKENRQRNCFHSASLAVSGSCVTAVFLAARLCPSAAIAGPEADDMYLVKGTVCVLCESYGLLRYSFHFPTGAMVIPGVLESPGLSFR